MEWRIYSEIEPWGYPEQDRQATFSRWISALIGGLTREQDGEPVGQKDMSLRHTYEKEWGFHSKKLRQSKEDITKAIKRLFGIA